MAKHDKQEVAVPQKEGPRIVNSARERSGHCTLSHFSVLVIIFGIILATSLGFTAGFSVGVHKARFSYRFGENYERNFVRDSDRDMKRRMIRKMDGKTLRNGHGGAGKILSLSGYSLVIERPDGQESAVTVSDTTVLRKGDSTVAIDSLAVGEQIVVIGQPDDDGSIHANFIRVFDPSEETEKGRFPSLFH